MEIAHIPTVSVVIPIYNVAEYVEVCLRSVLEQTHAALELVLVDDRGTDESMEIARRVVADYPERSVQFLVQPQNGGQSAARNRGVDVAGGEYILFVDSDDYLPDNSCVARLVEATVGGSVDLVFGDYSNSEYGDHELRFIPTVDYLKLEQVQLSGRRLGVDLWPVMQVAPWNKLFRRELAVSNDLSFTAGVIYEDLFWSLKLLYFARNYSHVEESTYVYRLRANSTMTSRVGARNVDSYIRSFDDCSSFLEVHAADFTPGRDVWILRAVNARRVMAVKMMIYAHDISIARWWGYLGSIAGSARGGVARCGMPRFTRAVSYALVMPRWCAVGYLSILRLLRPKISA